MKISDKMRRKRKEESILKIMMIKQIIEENKNLSLNEIKRKVKEKFPDIDIDKLTEIIVGQGILREEEKGER